MGSGEGSGVGVVEGCCVGLALGSGDGSGDGKYVGKYVGTLVGASSMGAMAVAYGIPSAMVTVATLQGAAALFFALRVPSTPVRGPNRRPAFAEEK